MSRPSRNTDERLLKAGRDLLPETGVNGLNLRRVAKKAGVNVGMFHYHFKTKDAFVRRVMQEYYEEIFTTLKTEAESGDTPLERLRSVLIAFGKVSRDRRKVVLSMLRDAFDGVPATLDFLRANLHRHVELILRLIVEAQAAGQIGGIAPVNAFTMLMTATNLPNIIAELAMRYGQSVQVAPVLAALEAQVLTDEAIADRVDAMLIGLAVQKDEGADLPPKHGQLEETLETARAAGA